MLVLSRKTEQEIICVDPANPESRLVIRVIKIKGGLVRLGIQAPSNIRVIRGELPENYATGGHEVQQPIEGETNEGDATTPGDAE